jgi:hypothetical protein
MNRRQRGNTFFRNTFHQEHKGKHAMANSDDKRDGAPPRDIHVGPATKKTNWFP